MACTYLDHKLCVYDSGQLMEVGFLLDVSSGFGNNTFVLFVCVCVSCSVIYGAEVHSGFNTVIPRDLHIKQPLESKQTYLLYSPRQEV